MAKLADLYLVGTGIYGLRQITLETRDIINVTAYLPARLILCWRIAEAICGLAQPVA